jgi:hypothetical protein
MAEAPPEEAPGEAALDARAAYVDALQREAAGAWARSGCCGAMLTFPPRLLFLSCAHGHARLTALSAARARAVYPAVPDVSVSYDFSYTVQLPAGGGQVRPAAPPRSRLFRDGAQL